MSNRYYYLTPKNVIRDGDEEWIYNEEAEEWGWYSVTCLSIGEHFQKGLDIRIRRSRAKQTLTTH